MREKILLLLWLVLFCGVGVGEQTPYKGIINYYDVFVNQFFTVDSAGNITLGDVFGEGEWRFWLVPRGHILLGFDNDFVTTKSLKWYRIEGESLVESPCKLPTAYSFPVVWTSTPHRCISGILPIRVWQLNPITLQATMLSEYSDTEARGEFASLVPKLGYVYYSDFPYTIRRVQYNEATGTVSGPVAIFPTPHMGNVDLVETSDGRLIVQLSSTDYLTIFHVEDDGTLTITQDHELYPEFGIANIHKATVSPDDHFLFLIARDGNNVNSFHLSTSGSITPITLWKGFDLAQALALTPDGRFLVVAHTYYYSQPAAILSVFEVGEDGSLTYLAGKDVPLFAMPAELAFLPPPDPFPTAAKNWTLYH
jgi:hypothetical protein